MITKELISEIKSKINDNHKQAVTGDILQGVLVDMVKSLCEVYPQTYTEEQKAQARMNIDALSNHNGEITKEKLSIEVQAILNDVANKQNISDAALATIAKTIVGAINEVYKGGLEDASIATSKIEDGAITEPKLDADLVNVITSAVQPEELASAIATALSSYVAKADIVSTTGSATDKVMSQHGVTEAIDGVTNKVTELEEQINGNIQVITPEFLPNYRYNLQRVVGDELRPFALLASDNCDCVSIEVNGGDKVRIIATPQKSTTYAWTLTSRITSSNSVIVKAIPNIGVAVDEVIDIVEDGILYVVCKIGSPRLLEISRKVDGGLKEEVSKIKTELGKVAPIYGKKVLFIGDSICAANEVDKILGGTDGGWAKRIGESYELIYVNDAAGGQVVTENLYNQSGALRRSILTKFNVNHSKLPDAEYTIFDIGTNDADVIGYIVETKSDGTIGLKDKADYPSAFGTWNYSDFSGEYDTNTFCGALEKYIHKTLTTYKGMKFGYIVAPKMALPQYSSYAPLRFANRKAYYDVAVAICKKWGVPVLNLWEDCWTNPFLSEHYDTTKTAAENISAGKYYLDGQHPTPTCYEYISPIIARWMESL